MSNSQDNAKPTAVQVVARKSKAMVEQGEREQNRTLTRTESKVLEVIMDPDLRHSKVCERIKAADCSKTRYWQIMHDPWFQQQRRMMLQAKAQERANAFFEAAAETASTPGRDGFQDRRMLLSLSGDHVERRQHDVQVEGRIVVGVIGVSMDELG